MLRVIEAAVGAHDDGARTTALFTAEAISQQVETLRALDVGEIELGGETVAEDADAHAERDNDREPEGNDRATTRVRERTKFLQHRGLSEVSSPSMLN